MNILLVEDHEESRETVAKLLVYCGHTVTAAESLAAANAACAQASFEVLLSDIGLLDGDAFDFVKSAKAARGIKKVVAITGRTATEDRERAQEAGVDHYLTKPIDFHELRSLLAEIPA